MLDRFGYHCMLTCNVLSGHAMRLLLPEMTRKNPLAETIVFYTWKSLIDVLYLTPLPARVIVLAWTRLLSKEEWRFNINIHKPHAMQCKSLTGNLKRHAEYANPVYNVVQ
jgi:hypothetical protein